MELNSKDIHKCAKTVKQPPPSTLQLSQSDPNSLLHQKPVYAISYSPLEQSGVAITAATTADLYETVVLYLAIVCAALTVVFASSKHAVLSMVFAAVAILLILLYSFRPASRFFK